MSEEPTDKLNEQTMALYVIEAAQLAIMAFGEIKRLSDLFERRFEPGFDMRALQPVVRSYLGCAAGISKLVWGSAREPGRGSTAHDKFAWEIRQERSRRLAAICGLGDDSALRDRDVRNALEHVDERIDMMVATHPPGELVTLVHGGIVDRSLVQGSMKRIYMGVFDPSTREFIWGDHAVKLQRIQDDIQLVQDSCVDWLVSRGYAVET